MDLFSLALRLTSVGIKEATAGLTQVDAVGKRAGASLAVVEAQSVRAARGITVAGTASVVAATQMTAASVASRALSGALLLFGGGAALTAGVTFGIGLIVSAYKALADGSRDATTATNGVIDKLLEQKQKLFELSDAFKEASRTAVLFAEINARQ